MFMIANFSAARTQRRDSNSDSNALEIAILSSD